MLGNVHDGSDALQEAMLQIVRKLDRFDGRSAFGTWAYRLTANVCLDELRRRKRRPEPAEFAADLPIDDVSGASLDRQIVDEALERLPDDYRAAVVLRDLCGYEYAEIAELTKVPIGTVRSRIARGRAALAGIIGNPEGGGDRPTI
jgi:RNA polymerase sigma-70 factor (ECF subfamily)